MNPQAERARNEAQAGWRWQMELSGIAAQCAFLRCFLILTSAHRARSGGRRTAGMSVRPSKRAGLVPSRCASVWHPGFFQGRYCPPSTACPHPGVVRPLCISISSSSSSSNREPAPASSPLLSSPQALPPLPLSSSAASHGCMCATPPVSTAPTASEQQPVPGH